MKYFFDSAFKKPALAPAKTLGHADAACFHCGLQFDSANAFPVVFMLAEKPTCCPGCQAAATAIINAGLGEYYEQRTAVAAKPAERPQRMLEQLAMFDLPEVQNAFVHPLEENQREANLIIEGVTCPACVWLIERHLRTVTGVVAAEINYASERATVRWDNSNVRLSSILRAVSDIGYTAHPYNSDKQASVRDAERKTLLWQIFVAGFAMMQVMMYALPVYLAGEGEMTPDISQLMRWASLILTTPVVFYSAAPFFRGAARDLRLRRLGMDVPVAIAIAVAYGASCWATLNSNGEVYFDSVAMFVFFLLGGRYLERLARTRAAESAERLVKFRPAIARVLADYPADMDEKTLAANSLNRGDMVRILPGDMVPADGVVVDGMSSVDEAMLTGESFPVNKQPGDALTGGTMNQTGPMIMRVSQAGAASRLAAIERLLERALAHRPAIALQTERVAGWFVGLILLTATAAGIAWLSIDDQRALWIAVSVLAVTCPCALSLATPVALTVATGRLANNGMLTIRANAIETFSRITHVVFDKTGTLTLGLLSLQETLPLSNLPPTRCLHIACALEQASEHPIAHALMAAARQTGEKIFPVADGLRNFPGGGVEGLVGGKRYRLGSVQHVAQLSRQIVPAIELDRFNLGAASVVVLGDETGFVAAFLLTDELRTEARLAVTQLQKMGKQVWLLSGDSEGPVARAARQLGIDHFLARQTPAQKMEAVKQLQSSGAVVAMVGDGVNDAPVLGQAQVSIAMGAASDLTQSAADMVLLTPDLSIIPDTLRLTQKTLLIIKQNLAWALAYNVIALPLAVAGFVTPWMAGLGMSLSSLVVVWNALRLGAAPGEKIPRAGRFSTAEPARNMES
ncbi:MAG: heavy metal translocating P-type ATPase [Burkholderiales bacterium]